MPFFQTNRTTTHVQYSLDRLENPVCPHAQCGADDTYTAMTYLSRHPFYLLLLMFSIFSCFKKKATYPKNVDAWVEANFPDKLVVVTSNWNYDVMDLLFRGNKLAVLADKADPEVQFTAKWSKPTETVHSLGLDSAEIQAKLDTCRADVARARELFKLLKNNGLQQFSVSSIEQSAYILVFQEPTPEARKQIITAVKTTLDERKEQPQTSIWIEIMEPAYYHVDFQDIVPTAFWQRPGTIMTSNKIMTLDFEWKKGIPLAALVKGWELNTNSDRIGKFMDSAYPPALAWAEKNLPKPFYLEPDQMIQYELETVMRDNETQNDLLSIRFTFPYYKTKPVQDESGNTQKIEPEGYVTGVYQTDEKTFTKIKRLKEL